MEVDKIEHDDGACQNARVWSCFEDNNDIESDCSNKGSSDNCIVVPTSTEPYVLEYEPDDVSNSEYTCEEDDDDSRTLASIPFIITNKSVVDLVSNHEHQHALHEQEEEGHVLCKRQVPNEEPVGNPDTTNEEG